MSLHRNIPIQDITILRLASGDLLEECLQATGQEMLRIADGLGRSQLIVDMEEVDFLTSTALGKLVALNTRVRAGGGRLIVANIGDAVYQIFEVTCLTQILDLRRASDGHSASVLVAC